MNSTVYTYDMKLFDKIRSKELLMVTDALTKSGYEVRLVGGVVRDLIQGKLANDIDLSTNATPDQMKLAFNNAKIRYIETGIKHGTITAHINRKDFEVTTLRTDMITDGRHAKVAYINDWKLDAERRDLTINAMSLCVYNGNLYDYFNGYSHLHNRRVQFVGDARKRIKEDYLRILRYFRFLGKISTYEDIIQLECSLKKDTNLPHETILTVIAEEAHGLSNISVERIWSELKRILIGPNAPQILKLMYLTNVLKYSNLIHVNIQHLNNFDLIFMNATKVISILANQYHINAVIQPSTLLAGVIDNCDQAESISNYLKFSNNEKALLHFIVVNRQSNKSCHNNSIPLKKYKDMLVSNYKLKEIDIIKQRILQIILYESTHENYNFLDKWNPPNFPVNGNHIKSKNFTGKEISIKLDYLKKLWIQSDYSLSLDDLLKKI